MEIKKLEPSDLEEINSIEIGFYDNNNDLTEQYPLLFIKDIISNQLCINGIFYNQNNDEIKKMLMFIAKNCKSFIFYIKDPKLLDNEFIDILLDNPIVKFIEIDIMDKLTKEEWELYCNSNPSINFIKKYGIGEEIFVKIAKSNKCVSLYDNKNILGKNSYDYIADSENIDLTDIKETQIKNLKYLKKDCIITFDSDSMDLNLLFKVINALQNLENSPSKIIIKVKEKKVLNEYLSQNKDLNTDKVVLNLLNELLDEVELNKYIEVENKINEMIQPVLNYSPFEQFLYVYNLVTQFKEYKESEENSNSSRSIYEIFDNEYIVCVGYASLLKELLDRLGIESKIIGVDVDDGFDDVSLNADILPEGIEVHKNGHERLIVNMVDSMYDINGYYVSDPTWDNDLENKYYIYSLMTAKETVSHERYLFYDTSDCMELFYSKNIEEFNEKIAFYLKRNNYLISNFYKSLLEIFDLAINDETLRKKIFEVTGKIDLKNPPIFTKDELINILKKTGFIDYSFINKYREELEDELNNFYYKTELSDEYILSKLISKIMEVFKVLDNEFYLKIKSKFNILNNFYDKISKTDAKQILSDIGNHIVIKSNKLINPNKFYNALKHLYKDVYQMENYKEYSEKVIKINEESYVDEFPYLGIIDEEQNIEDNIKLR